MIVRQCSEDEFQKYSEYRSGERFINIAYVQYYRNSSLKLA